MKYKFVDFFAGIGGFHIALHKLGAECVAACERDKYARQTYEHNFKAISPAVFSKNRYYTDVQKINPNQLPDYDIFCAVFHVNHFHKQDTNEAFKKNATTGVTCSSKSCGL